MAGLTCYNGCDCNAVFEHLGFRRVIGVTAACRGICVLTLASGYCEGSVLSNKCDKCGASTNRGAGVCPVCSLPAVPQETREDINSIVASREYALSSDLQACQAIESIPVLPRAVEWVMNNWNTPLYRARLLGDGVRVSSNQLQTVHSLAHFSASRLGMPTPDVFVKQDPTLNAYTLGTNSDPIIVIHSALVEQLEQDELLFVIGHEMGHVHCRHVVYNTIAKFIATGLGALAASLFHPLSMAISAWQREGELTADRAGVIVCQNPEASLKAIAMLAVGSRKMLAEMNLASYLGQSLANKSFHADFDRVFSARSHPYLSTRAEKLVEFVRSPSGRDLVGLSEPRYSNALSAPISSGRTEGTASQPRFCPACGFEAIRSNGRAVCPVCGIGVD